MLTAQEEWLLKFKKFRALHKKLDSWHSEATKALAEIVKKDVNENVYDIIAEIGHDSKYPIFDSYTLKTAKALNQIFDALCIIDSIAPSLEEIAELEAKKEQVDV